MTVYSMRNPMETIAQQNIRILRTIDQPSAIELPPMFLVYRHSRTDPSVRPESAWNACLISTQQVHNPQHPYIWEFTIVETPIEVLNGGILLNNQSMHDDWCLRRSHRILVKRASRSPAKNGKYVPTELSYAGSYVLLDHRRIPVFSLTEPTICLASTFKRLDQPEYSQWRLALEPFMPIISPSELDRMQQRRLPRYEITPAERIVQNLVQTTHSHHISTPLTSSPGIPQHIVNTYIDSLIARNETCPISMAELTRETACLTPCGHLSARHEAERWIRDAHSCPVCRSPCSVAGLQSWRQ